jgi:hypothetical protein
MLRKANCSWICNCHFEDRRDLGAKIPPSEISPLVMLKASFFRSTSSAAAEAALFARFHATSGGSDFSLALIIGYSLRPSRQRPGHDWRGRRWRSPGSRAKGFCACQGLRRRGVGVCLAISTPAVWPSVGRKTSAPRTCLTPLNTSPAPSPVNASRLSSRTTRASLGASAVRYSFTVTDFHRLPLAGLPAHPSTASISDMRVDATQRGTLAWLPLGSCALSHHRCAG